MLPKQQLDELSAPSRHFYERAYAKLVYSLILSSFGMMFLGFCSIYGGLSSYEKFLEDALNPSGNEETASKDLQAGYGFACFFCLLASFFLFGIAIYISPYLSSSNEKTVLKLPQEIVSVRNMASTTFSDNIEGANKI
jgi:hypothetical protein